MFFISRWSGGKGLLILGSMLILFGVLIAVYPQILVVLISSFFLFLGLVLFGLGLQRYQVSKKMGSPQSFVPQEPWKRP